jgi:GTP-binding protein HflX
VTEADLILHVRDIAHPDSEAQARDVAHVLAELGIDDTSSGRIIEVWNKIDLLPEGSRPVRASAADASPVVPVSALTGAGLQELLELIERRVSSDRSVFRVELSGEGLALLHRLYELGEVLERTDTAEGSTVARVRVPAESLSRFRRSFPDARKAS